MSCSQDIIKCPQCGGICVFEFDCGTLEEFQFCNRCGMRESYEVVWDEKGEAVLDDEGKVKYIHTESTGLGCMAIASRKGVTTIYNLIVPVNEEVLSDYHEAMKNPDVCAEKSYLTSWDAEKQEIVALFGVLPGSYDEFMSNEEGDEAING